MLGLTFIIIALFPLDVGFRLWIKKKLIVYRKNKFREDPKLNSTSY